MMRKKQRELERRGGVGREKRGVGGEGEGMSGRGWGGRGEGGGAKGRRGGRGWLGRPKETGLPERVRAVLCKALPRHHAQRGRAAPRSTARPCRVMHGGAAGAAISQGGHPCNVASPAAPPCIARQC